jgi:hypothetical protein
MNDLPKYFKQAAEWQRISEELQAKTAPGEGVTAYQVTLEQKKRCLARGEKFMEYEDILNEYHEHNPDPLPTDPPPPPEPSIMPGPAWVEINLHELLARMTLAMPPPQGQKHGICLTDDGRLQLTLRVGGTAWEAFLIDPSIGQGPKELVKEILELRKTSPAPEKSRVKVEYRPIRDLPTIPVPGERTRRTDDGTYPNAGEEIEKIARRASAAKDPASLKALSEQLATVPSMHFAARPVHTCVNTATTVDGSPSPPCKACQLADPLDKK